MRFFITDDKVSVLQCDSVSFLASVAVYATPFLFVILDILSARLVSLFLSSYSPFVCLSPSLYLSLFPLHFLSFPLTSFVLIYLLELQMLADNIK